MKIPSLLAFLAVAACFVSAYRGSRPELLESFVDGIKGVLISERFVFMEDLRKFCPYDTERWSNFTEGVVCFGAPGNEFATAVTQMEGFLQSIKLVHVSGHVLCDKSSPRYKSKWGCPRSHPVYGGTPFNVVITTGESNSIIYPTELSLKDKGESLWYDVPGVEPDSSELILGDSSNPHYVASGQELRVWLAEDLMKSRGKNIKEKICITVQGWFM